MQTNRVIERYTITSWRFSQGGGRARALVRHVKSMGKKLPARVGGREPFPSRRFFLPEARASVSRSIAANGENLPAAMRLGELSAYERPRANCRSLAFVALE